MPTPRKNDVVRCTHFTWRLVNRSGNWYADGRSPRTRIGDEPDRVPFESAQGDRQSGWLRYLAAGHVMERAF